MSALTEKLRLVVDGDSKGAVKALKDATKAGDDLSKSSGSWGKHLDTAATAALGAGAALAGVIAKSTATYSDYGKAVKSVYDITNLGAEGSSRLVAQFQAFGVDAEAGGKAARFFERSLDYARQGMSQYVLQFQRLGMSQEELKQKSDVELLGEMRDRMSQLGDATTQTSIAMQLMGRSGSELSDWYQAAPAEMQRVNDEIQKSGLVWDDKHYAQYMRMVEAQREFNIAITGLQIKLVQSGVVDTLTQMVGQVGSLLSALGPLAKLIPYAATGLLAFGTAVKAVRLATVLRDLGSKSGLVGALGRLVGGFRDARVAGSAFSGMAGTLGGRLRMVVDAVGSSVASFARYIAKVPAVIAANVALAASYAAVAAAAAGAGVAIYEAIKAYRAWQDAVGQANQAASNAASENERAFSQGKISQSQYESNKAAIQRDAYKTPWYMKPSQFIGNLIPGLADEGIVRARPGGTIVRIAEGGEDEAVVKASRLTRQSAPAGPSIHVTVTGNTFVGTSGDAERQIAAMIDRHLKGDFMRQVRYAQE